MSKARSFKVNLNAQASEDLSETAKALGVTESEILRRGLAVMKYYAKSHQQNADSQLLLKEGNRERELIVI
ncbi:conserved hypothetical protein [Rippkaea orientalis PCC 8801]|uniref:CopG domain protein DNA-binding domain protein n=1 Tax=Rippkaea orientalis (strain PCC 8801 / RF-1) TaxID=41431 RepID=B7K1Q5_RIPO1|nr:hypothetical protein [Rippkaea orientalis]ACK67597.1 conserved hypothetical protein [Rippkaea orientalis PCC 8801]